MLPIRGSDDTGLDFAGCFYDSLALDGGLRLEVQLVLKGVDLSYQLLLRHLVQLSKRVDITITQFAILGF